MLNKTRIAGIGIMVVCLLTFGVSSELNYSFASEKTEMSSKDFWAFVLELGPLQNYDDLNEVHEVQFENRKSRLCHDEMNRIQINR